MTNKKLEWALTLAKRGIRIVPLHHTLEDGSCSCGKPREGDNRCRSPGKHPTAFEWDKVATANTKVVKRWFDNTPEMNYGVVADAGLYLLDIDSKKSAPGYQTACELLDVQLDELRDVSFSVLTTSGGMHLYFLAEKAYSNTARTVLGAGLDSRSGHGYVVGPGSQIYVPTEEEDEFKQPICELREYEVLNDTEFFTPLPESIESKLHAARERSEDAGESVCESMVDHEVCISRARNVLKIRPPAIEGQGGNDHTYVTAEVCRDLNLSEDATIELLMEEGGWNERCEPPWEYDELKTVIANAYRYAKSPMGNKGGYLLALADDSQYTFGDEDLDNDSELPDSFEFDDERPKREIVFHDGESVNTLDIHYDFIIDGWLPAKNYTIVLGPRGSGKTTYIMDAVCHVVTDSAWHGSDVDADWHFIYIAAEDFPGVKERYEAWCTSHTDVTVFNQTTGRYQIKDPSRIQFVEMAIDLLDFEEVNKFGIKVKELVKNLRAKNPKKVIKIAFVFDTWQRVTAAAQGGQSSDESMQKALNSLEALASWFKGPCIIAAHPPKTNKDTMSGSQIIENRSDALWQIGDAAEGNKRPITVARIKGAPENVSKELAMVTKPIGGFDKFGRQRQSVTVEYRGGTTVNEHGNRERKVSKNQQDTDGQFGALVRDMILNNGNVDPQFNSGGGPFTEGKFVRLMCHVFSKKFDGHETVENWRFRLQDVGLNVDELKKYAEQSNNAEAVKRAETAKNVVMGFIDRHKGGFRTDTGDRITFDKPPNGGRAKYIIKIETSLMNREDKFSDDEEEEV